MQDWSDRMLDLNLNEPTINGKGRSAGVWEQQPLKQYEKIGPMASPFIKTRRPSGPGLLSSTRRRVRRAVLPDLRDRQRHGLTIFPDDGSTPIVCISRGAHQRRP